LTEVYEIKMKFCATHKEFIYSCNSKHKQPAIYQTPY
jgi:hypothetical protein